MFIPNVNAKKKMSGLLLKVNSNGHFLMHSSNDKMANEFRTMAPYIFCMTTAAFFVFPYIQKCVSVHMRRAEIVT